MLKISIYMYIFKRKNIYTTNNNCFRLSYICIIVKCSWQFISNTNVRAHEALKLVCLVLYLPFREQFRYDDVQIFLSVVLNISLYHKYVLAIKKGTSVLLCLGITNLKLMYNKPFSLSVTDIY